MTQSAHERAIEVFEALVSAPVHEAYATPAGLIRAAGLPVSSGYRHTATLEAEGFLRRDSLGTYLSGPSAVRVGLQGFGLGLLAPLVQPILLQLSQSTQLTSFMAISQDMDLFMGPHSIGRETRNAELQRSYSFETVPDLSLGSVSEVGLRWFEDRLARRSNVLLVSVASTTDSIALVGLMMNSVRAATEGQIRALNQAYDQIANSKLENQ